jgi:hypothetical protein
MNIVLTSLVSIALLGRAPLHAADLPSTVLISPDHLRAVKASVETGSKEYAAALKRLRRDAEKALAQVPVSVMDKKQTPPSGDKHDYMSMGKYWWPDPSKPGGTPYMRRDGEANPESNEITDHDNFARLVWAVESLGLAHYFFGGEENARHAAKLVRVWFFDPATRMNPNMNYAQAVPGREEGRGAGIIDVRGFPRLLDGLALLETSQAWTQEDKRIMQTWIREYLVWLRESKNGKAEAAARNNHGTWYDVQVMSLALYVGDQDLATSTATAAQTKRIASQIRPDGKQPEELLRTRSWGYSTMNLAGLFDLATLAERVGVDLWQYVAPSGGSIRKAFDYLYPYLTGDKTWEHQEIRKFDPVLLVDVLRVASVKFDNKEYARLSDVLAAKDGASRRGVLLYPSLNTP